MKLYKSPLTLAALAAWSLTACSSAPPPKLVVDPTLANASVFEVDGLKNRHWGKPLTFGPYHTEKTRVGESWTWSVGLFGPQFGARNDPYRFQFVDDTGASYKVECRAKTPMLRRSTRHGEWSFPVGETKLSCAIQDPAGNVGSLALRGYEGDYSGETGFAEIDDFEIGALHQFASESGRKFSLPVAIGYELKQGGKVVAAVDTFSHGRVYLGQDLDPKSRTAAAITLTVLMFFHEV